MQENLCHFIYLKYKKMKKFLLLFTAFLFSFPQVYAQLKTNSKEQINSVNDTLVLKNTMLAEAVIISPQNDTTICESSFLFEAEEPETGSGLWQITSGGGNIENPDSNITYINNLWHGVNTIRWTVIGDTCTSSDDVEITNSSVFANAGVDVAVCADYAYLNASPVPPGDMGLWSVISGTGMFEDPTNNTTIVSDLSFGNNTFRWTVSNNECTSYSDVNVFSTMPDSALYDAGEDQEVCEDHTVLEANELLPGWEGRWEIVGGGGTIAEPTNRITEVSNLILGLNVFRWIIFWPEYGCYYSDIVTVSNNSVSATAGQDTTINQTSYQLNAENPIDGSGEWSVVSGAGIIENPNLHNTVVGELGTGKNIFCWSVTNDFCDDSDFIRISYNPVSVEHIEKKNSKICPNPTGGIVNIVSENRSFSEAFMRLQTIAGKEMPCKIIPQSDKFYMLDVSNLAEGIYFLEIHFDTETETLKIIKK